MVKSTPGVHPKPRFGLMLDSTGLNYTTTHDIAKRWP